MVGAGKSTSASAATTLNRHSTVTPERVAEIYRCGIERAKETLRLTTQRHVRKSREIPGRRYRVPKIEEEYRWLEGVWHSDTLFPGVKSINNEVAIQCFTNGEATFVYGLRAKSDEELEKALRTFMKDVGIPRQMVTDMAPEMTGYYTGWQKIVRRHPHMVHKFTEPGRHNQNGRAEVENRELRKFWYRVMMEKKMPVRLWGYAFRHCSELRSRMYRNGKIGWESVIGHEVDISEYLDFDLYDWLWVYDPDYAGPTKNDYDPTNDPDTKNRRLGRFLGIAHNIGSKLTYWVLVSSGKVIPRSTVWHVTHEEATREDTRNRMKVFDETIATLLGDEQVCLTGGPSDSELLGLGDIGDEVEHCMDPGGEEYLREIDPTGNVTEVRGQEKRYIEEKERVAAIIEDVNTMRSNKQLQEDLEKFDALIGAEVRMPHIGGNEHGMMATVKRRKRDSDGRPIGIANKLPFYDSRLYDLEFEDGTVMEYRANVILENLMSQVDEEGRQYRLIDEIIDHRRDADAIPIEKSFYTHTNGRKYRKKTTRGWKLLVRWKDGQTSWVLLSEMKETFLIETAEYAVARRLADEAAFAWWVPFVLKKRKHFVSRVAKKYWRTTHKYGIQLPKSLKEAQQLDDRNGNTKWMDATLKEMKKVMVAFEFDEKNTPEDIRAKGGKHPDYIGYQEIPYHLVYDVKMDLAFKARLVAGGHTTDAPASLTYSSVVSRDSVRIGFLLAALNELDICAADIGNAYLNAPCREKIWFEAGPEFGENKGKTVKVVRALYGLKSSGAAFRKHLAERIESMGFVSTRADPDVYIRAATDGGFKYYEMIFTYVDDLLVMSRNTKPIMETLSNMYELKKGSVGTPDIYLGAHILKDHQVRSGTLCWAQSPDQYTATAIKNLEDLLENEDGITLDEAINSKQMHKKQKLDDGTAKEVKYKHVQDIFPAKYRAELDDSPYLNDELSSRYSQLIGVLRWAIELGRVDIFYEVSILSQYLAAPRQGHLLMVYRTFSFLKGWPKCAIVYDPDEPVIDESVFHKVDWSEFYGEMQEQLPPKMPEARGRSVITSCFVDSDHAGNKVTRRSHTGILIFVQKAPIIWYSKRQNTVEASTHSSEFIALRTAVEKIKELRYKLRMFGVPIDGPVNVFVDNAAVVKNASIPESTLQKRHNAINYHYVREACAMDIIRVGKEDGEWNLADVFTKRQMKENKFRLLGFISRKHDTVSKVAEVSGLSQLVKRRIRSAIRGIFGSDDRV